MTRHVGLILLFFGIAAPAADWPQWRGVHRDGKSAETGLLESWPRSGPRLLWKVQDLGDGYSGPAIAGDRLYVQGQQGGQQFVMAYDVHSGRPLWKTAAGRAFNGDRGHGPRSTPTVDGARLYALSADGTLACLEAASGRRIWELNLIEQFAGRPPNWGYSESPLVDGDRVVVTPGGPAAAVVALNKNTGNLLWKSQNDRAGYSSAIALDIGGTHALALLTAEAAIGLDSKDGALLWRYTRVANRVANIATPIANDGYVFFSTDYGTGCVLLKPTPDGKTAEVYFNRDMRNHYTTSVLVGDYLYGFSSEILTAMEFKTGKVAWRDRSVGKGNCIYAGQRLYCMGEDGAIGLIDPTPAAYKEVSRFEIPRGAFNTWTPPAVANGQLYLREQNNLYCYDIKR
ncbi:MAG TPA: PQQ-binding-like beta-propeller repeat protein [Bryobacteraceae bacterium]|jgi:outer membrane protein assembly factor BamB